MSDFSERAFELSDRRATEKREASLQRLRAGLIGENTATHCGCGEPIPEARRKAVPNTRDCIDCASEKERR